MDREGKYAGQHLGRQGGETTGSSHPLNLLLSEFYFVVDSGGDLGKNILESFQALQLGP